MRMNGTLTLPFVRKCQDRASVPILLAPTLSQNRTSLPIALVKHGSCANAFNAKMPSFRGRRCSRLTLAPDRLHPVEIRDGSDTLQQFAVATLGRSAAIPDLNKSGYRLMGGRAIPTATAQASC